MNYLKITIINKIFLCHDRIDISEGIHINNKVHEIVH